MKIEELAKGIRTMYTFEQPNSKGETIQVEFTKCSGSLSELWKKNGYTYTALKTWWGVHVYATDNNNNCYNRYNPTITKCANKLNFEWVLEATEENRNKILEEIKKRAYA